MRLLSLSLLLILFSAGSVWAEDSSKSLLKLTAQTRFSRDAVVKDMAKSLGSNWTLNRSRQAGEPRVGQRKSVPMTIIGLGLVGVGGALAATAGNSATITFTDPITQQPITTKVSATNNGQRWGGIGLLGSGVVLTLRGLRVF